MAISKEDNARSLAAWNAWKEVCWVHGLGKPRGDLPVVGSAEDEQLLAKMIRNAFVRKLAPFMEQLADLEGNVESLADLDCAQEFDNALIEYEFVDRRDRRFNDGEEPHFRQKKAWKDFVWASLAASDDPPLKVIIGQLLGAKGVIDQVVEDWLLSNFSARFHGDLLEFLRSRDAAEVETREDGGSDEGSSLGNGAGKAIPPNGFDPMPETGGAPRDDVPEDVSEQTLDSWRKELDGAFTARLCCLMLAHIHGVKLYADTEILDALGIGKTKAADDLKNAVECLSNLNPELRDWIINDDSGTKFFKKWIENRCRTEKAAALILSRMKSER